MPSARLPEEFPELAVLVELIPHLDEKTSIVIGPETERLRNALTTAGAPPVQVADLESSSGEDLPGRPGIVLIAQTDPSEILESLRGLASYLVLCSYLSELPPAYNPPSITLEDLVSFMAGQGYDHYAVFRHNGPFVSVTFNDARTTPGEWGNVLFVADDMRALADPVLWEAAAEAQRVLVDHASRLDARDPLYLPITLESDTMSLGMRRELERLSRIVQDRQATAGEQPGDSAADHSVPGHIGYSTIQRPAPLFGGLFGSVQERTIMWRLANLLTPKVGWLAQHGPMPLHIPTRYRRTRQFVDPPAISIVTPSLNQGAFLEATILSVLGQEYSNLEYVVQDGGSTDQTNEILARYRSVLKGCESRPDNGHANAINLGFRQTTGEIMGYLNSDDILLPGALLYVGRYFRQHPDVAAVYGHRIVVDTNGNEVGRWVLPRHDDRALSAFDYIPAETLFWRRSLWDKAGGGLDEGLSHVDDWELVLRFADAGARFVRLPRFLGAFRVHPYQRTTETPSVTAESDVLRARHGGPVGEDAVWDRIKPYMRRHLIAHALYRARLLRY